MSSLKSIGGYFELELPNTGMYRDNTLLLNSARSCLEYILSVKKPKKVYVPKFTCDVILEPFHRTDTEYEFYSINQLLEISQEISLEQDELILYTNYFGVKDSYCNEIAKKFGDRLIIDASQAYYYTPASGVMAFYSPRKYFGVSDGGELINTIRNREDFPKDISIGRFGHLLKRIELGPEMGYEQFKLDDDSLINQGIKLMSTLTEKILASIDYDGVKARRRENFLYLHTHLADSNTLNINLESAGVPMVYPYLINIPGIRQKLINKSIYIASYWPNVKDWANEDEFEYMLPDNLLALPIDQRYNIDDMKRIVEAIHECQN